MRGPFGILLVGGGIILIIGLFSGKISFVANTAGSVPPGVPSENPSSVGANISGHVNTPGNPSCPPGFSYDPGYKKCVPTVNAING